MDKAHKQTDLKLEEIEKRLTAIYKRANKEIVATADEYFKQFEKQDKEHLKLLSEGKITEKEYKLWRKNKMMTGKRYKDMKEQTAEQLLHINETALAYINGELPEIYALNYNHLAEAVDGVGGYSFTLTDANTVRNLAIADKTLLPYKYVNGTKDVRWNTKKVNAEVLQGILQGDSINKIADRLQRVTEMNRTSAIRNARTTVTSAECKGRQDSYSKASKDGIILKKCWMSTNDKRTRHWHADLNGVQVGVDESFYNDFGEIKYPGDVHANPANVYNCRCTTVARVLGFVKAKVENAVENVEKPVKATVKPKTKPVTYTKGEMEAAEWYVSGEGMYVNQIMRGRMQVTELSDFEKEAIKNLETLTEKQTVKEKVLYRGVDAEAIFGKMSNSDYVALTDTIYYGEKAKQKLIDDTIGKEITEKGFMSTTKDKGTAMLFEDFTGSEKPIVLELEVPDGIKGYDMKKFEVEGEEQYEVLLAKNQKYKIKDIRKETYKYTDEYGEDFTTAIYVVAELLK